MIDIDIYIDPDTAVDNNRQNEIVWLNRDWVKQQAEWMEAHNH